MSEWDDKTLAALNSGWTALPCNSHPFAVLHIAQVGCALCYIRELEAKLEEAKDIIKWDSDKLVEYTQKIVYQQRKAAKLITENKRLRENEKVVIDELANCFEHTPNKLEFLIGEMT